VVLAGATCCRCGGGRPTTDSEESSLHYLGRPVDEPSASKRPDWPNSSQLLCGERATGTRPLVPVSSSNLPNSAPTKLRCKGQLLACELFGRPACLALQQASWRRSGRRALCALCAPSSASRWAQRVGAAQASTSLPVGGGPSSSEFAGPTARTRSVCMATAQPRHLAMGTRPSCAQILDIAKRLNLPAPSHRVSSVGQSLARAANCYVTNSSSRQAARCDARRGEASAQCGRWEMLKRGVGGCGQSRSYRSLARLAAQSEWARRRPMGRPSSLDSRALLASTQTQNPPLTVCLALIWPVAAGKPL